MKFHDAYVSDTTQLLGGTLPHDDSMNDRDPAGCLAKTYKKTVFQWSQLDNQILTHVPIKAGRSRLEDLCPGMSLFAKWFFKRREVKNKISDLDKSLQFRGGMWRGDIENAGLASVHDSMSDKQYQNSVLKQFKAKIQSPLRIVKHKPKPGESTSFHADNAKHGWQQFDAMLETTPASNSFASVFWRSMDKCDTSNNRFIELHPPISSHNAHELSQPLASVSFLKEPNIPSHAWVEDSWIIRANYDGCAMSIQDHHGHDAIILFGTWSGHESATPKKKRRKDEEFNHAGVYGALDLVALYHEKQQTGGGEWFEFKNFSTGPRWGNKSYPHDTYDGKENFLFPGAYLNFDTGFMETNPTGSRTTKFDLEFPVNISIALALGITAMRAALDPSPSYEWYHKQYPQAQNTFTSETGRKANNKDFLSLPSDYRDINQFPIVAALGGSAAVCGISELGFWQPMTHMPMTAETIIDDPTPAAGCCGGDGGGCSGCGCGCGG